MAEALTTTLDDRDPNNELPIQPHQWGIRLEFAPVGNTPGGSWSFDAPNELWAQTIKLACDQLTDEQWEDLISNSQHRSGN